MILLAACCFLISVRLNLFGQPEIVHHASATGNPNVKIRLSTSALTDAIRPGENFLLKIELWNDGPGDVFVCKEFDRQFSPLCHTAIFLEDRSGLHSSLVLSAPDFSPSQKQTLSAVLLRDWISLRQDHSYGAIITIDPDAYPQLRKPGRYRIIARYSSEGVVAGYQNSVSLDPDEFKHLPASSWEGEIESTPVNVHVTGGK